MKFTFRRPRKRSAIQQAIVYALAAALTLPVNLSVHAANNPLAAVADVNTLDYVVNVDWDFDNPPNQVGNPNQRLDRAFITNLLRVTAQSVFTYTEGRHRIGTVFIYRNKLFGNNVDIQVINQDGRSNAHVSGWGKPAGWTSHNFLTISGNPYSLDEAGKVIAHELGHYTYGLLDEYADNNPNSTLPRIPSFPQAGDTVKPTMMNNHVEFLPLSRPTDYTDPSQRATAQFRVYGNSHWETLARPAEQDVGEARGYQRTFFEAFRGVNAAQLQLTQPVAGFDARLNLVFVSNPVFRDVIVVDRTVSAERFAELMQAAKALVAQAKPDTQFAIVASPPVGSGTTVLGYTDASIEGKQALNTALDALTAGATGTFDSLGAFTQAFNLLTAARKTGDPATFHLMTGAETSVPVETANTARTARVAINPLGITGGTDQARQYKRSVAREQSAAATAINLSDLANRTGGVYNSARTGIEAAKDVVRAAKETHADPYVSLSFDESAALAANAQFTSRFNVASAATDGEVYVELFFDPADAAKLQFSLVAPNGTVYTPANLPAGISFENDATEGVVLFTLAPNLAGRQGQWTARAQARSATKEGVGLEVSSNASVKLAADVAGGVAGSNIGPVLRASLGGLQRIRDAVVTANVYTEDGKLVLANAALRDDGVAPDTIQSDGQYVLDLSGKLPAGEYYAVLSAQTNANSRISAFGAQVKGTLDREVAVEALTRVTEASFSLETGAPGVGISTPTPSVPTTPTSTAPISTTTTPSTPVTSTTATASTPPATATSATNLGIPPSTNDDSGGCTTNPNGRDASLLLLLMAAVVGWLLRRRKWLARSGSDLA